MTLFDNTAASRGRCATIPVSNPVLALSQCFKSCHMSHVRYLDDQSWCAVCRISVQVQLGLLDKLVNARSLPIWPSLY